MTQDQDETPREQLARQAVEAYNELTAHAEELSPAAVQAVRGLRETLTSRITEAEITETYEVARSTARRTLAVLRDEGLIYTVPQRGSYVR